MLQLTFSERRYGHAIKQRKKAFLHIFKLRRKRGLKRDKEDQEGLGSTKPRGQLHPL